jgi:PAS domain S-box-containing protein
VVSTKPNENALPYVQTGRALPTRARLVILVTAILVPVILFAAALLWRYAEREHERFEHDALVLARQLTVAVDRELNGLAAALETLATSPALQPGGDLAAFDAQARALLRTRGSFISMRDRDGQQIVNTARSFGAPLPASIDPVLRDTDRRVFATGRTVVSDLYIGSTTGLKLILIDAPVVREGAVAYALNIVLDPARLAEMLALAAPSPDWTLAIVDGRDRIVARSREHERFLGSEATADLRARTRGRQEGTWAATTLEGTQALGAFVRSEFSGWRFVVGVPLPVIEAPLRNLIWLLIGSTVFVLALSLALAALFARGIAGPIYALTGMAGQLEQGKLVPQISTGLREVNEVGEALAAAAVGMQKREESLKASEQRLRLALEASRMAVWENNTATNTIKSSPELNQLLGLPPEANPSADEIWARFAPGERTKLQAVTAAAIAREERFVEDEIKVIWPDGSQHWLLLRADIEAADFGEVRTIGVAMDVTARKRAEQHQQLLINELNHRVKNTLATVQSIASQSLRGAEGTEDAKHAIESRLLALSRVHDVLTRENWESASLREIIVQAMAPYTSTREGRVQIDGPDVRLLPGMALALAMALQELATNAIKYGALSTAGGKIEIRWDCLGSVERRLHLTWRERGGPAVTPPKRRGFGIRLIERSLAQDLDGEAKIDFKPDGIVCTVNAPLPSEEMSEHKPAGLDPLVYG